MKKTLEDLAIYCQCRPSTLRPYLARAEFNSCHTPRSYLYNITDEQLLRLRELVITRRGNKNFDEIF